MFRFLRTRLLQKQFTNNISNNSIYFTDKCYYSNKNEKSPWVIDDITEEIKKIKEDKDQYKFHVDEFIKTLDRNKSHDEKKLYNETKEETKEIKKNIDDIKKIYDNKKEEENIILTEKEDKIIAIKKIIDENMDHYIRKFIKVDRYHFNINDISYIDSRNGYVDIGIGKTVLSTFTVYLDKDQRIKLEKDIGLFTVNDKK